LKAPRRIAGKIPAAPKLGFCGSTRRPHFRIAVQQRASRPDAIIVGRSIFEIDPHTISDTKVVTTILGGKFVYEADAK
jgi:hypothetical protein